MSDGLVDIKLIGFDELERDFHRLKFSIQKRIFRNAMAKAVEPVAAAARTLVPVDTGRLRDSIATRVITSRGKILGQVYCGDEMFKGDQYYAGMVEYGHRIGKRPKSIMRHAKGLAKLRKTQRSVHSTALEIAAAAKEEAKIVRLNETREGFVPAQPFLRPALAQQRNAAFAILGNSVAEQVKAYIEKKGDRHFRATIPVVGKRIAKVFGKSRKTWAKRTTKVLKAVGVGSKRTRRRRK